MTDFGFCLRHSAITVLAAQQTCTVLAIQVHNLLTQPRLLHLLLKVIQRIQENIVITVLRTQISRLLCEHQAKKLTHNG
jgi:hypothetical protein